MKKIILALLGLFISCIIAAIGLYDVWSSYSPVAITGSNIKTQSSDLTSITTEWFQEFFDQYKGIQVPFDYRIKNKKIETITVLDEKNGFVQLDYLIQPRSANGNLLAYYNASFKEKGWYKAQVVLQFVRTSEGFVIQEKMSPVQYQIKFDPALRVPQTPHYAMSNEKETYMFRKNQLFVTYDSGATLLEVPVSYDDIAGSNQGTYNEVLPSHGYIVSKAFTGFVCYDATGSYLLYSEDAGVTWNQLNILGVPYRSEQIYLSKTNQGCYVTLAANRSLGHEYFTTLKTTDFKSWKQLVGKMVSEASIAVFFDNQIGYMYASHDESNNPQVYRTADDGMTATKITLPRQEIDFHDIKITPFIAMEYAYQENGKVYLVIGQGPDGDYTKDNTIIKGLYSSEDGVNFIFEKEISDSLTPLG